MVAMSTESPIVTWSSHAVPRPRPRHPAPALIVVYRIVSGTLHCTGNYGMDAQKTMKCPSLQKAWPLLAPICCGVTRRRDQSSRCQHMLPPPPQHYLALLTSRHSQP